MDFITYDFESSAQFFAELKDLLGEGGFHDSPESQVNTFLSLIVQYQDEFLDASGQDLAHCCYRLFDSDLFQQNTLSVASAIIDRAIQSQSENDMWITYHALYYAGMEFPKVYHWMLKSEFFAKLKYQILRTDDQGPGTRLQPLAVSLMYEICRVQTLKSRDLALLDEDFLHYLLDLVERTRTDADEGLNYGAIKLLLTFNEQYMLNQAVCKAAYNYTPSNPLLSVLADRPGASCTFGENLIFMLNRAEETALQTLILKLLYLFFTSPNPYLSQFFYTNDLHVLIDVVIRELWNLPEEQESLRHAYLRVLAPLLTNTQLRQHHPFHQQHPSQQHQQQQQQEQQQRNQMYKRAEILKVLRELGGGEMDEALRQCLWEEEYREQQSRLLNTETRKLTYRDRQSSNASLAPSAPSSTSSSSTAPIAIERKEQKERPGVSKSGSVILENVLPPSRSNSSTNLHVHMSAAPASVGKERRESQQQLLLQHPLRAVSPTTQRLVERVLREWFENDMKPSETGVEEEQQIAVPVAQ